MRSDVVFNVFVVQSAATIKGSSPVFFFCAVFFAPLVCWHAYSLDSDCALICLLDTRSASSPLKISSLFFFVFCFLLFCQFGF